MFSGEMEINEFGLWLIVVRMPTHGQTRDSVSIDRERRGIVDSLCFLLEN